MQSIAFIVGGLIFAVVFVFTKRLQRPSPTTARTFIRREMVIGSVAFLYLAITGESFVASLTALLAAVLMLADAVSPSRAPPAAG